MFRFSKLLPVFLMLCTGSLYGLLEDPGEQMETFIKKWHLLRDPNQQALFKDLPGRLAMSYNKQDGTRVTTLSAASALKPEAGEPEIEDNELVFKEMDLTTHNQVNFGVLGFLSSSVAYDTIVTCSLERKRTAKISNHDDIDWEICKDEELKFVRKTQAILEKQNEALAILKLIRNRKVLERQQHLTTKQRNFLDEINDYLWGVSVLPGNTLDIGVLSRFSIDDLDAEIRKRDTAVKEIHYILNTAQFFVIEAASDMLLMHQVRKKLEVNTEGRYQGVSIDGQFFADQGDKEATPMLALVPMQDDVLEGVIKDFNLAPRAARTRVSDLYSGKTREARSRCFLRRIFSQKKDQLRERQQALSDAQKTLRDLKRKQLSLSTDGANEDLKIRLQKAESREAQLKAENTLLAKLSKAKRHELDNVFYGLPRNEQLEWIERFQKDPKLCVSKFEEQYPSEEEPSAPQPTPVVYGAPKSKSKSKGIHIGNPFRGAGRAIGRVLMPCRGRRACDMAEPDFMDHPVGAANPAYVDRYTVGTAPWGLPPEGDTEGRSSSKGKGDVPEGSPQPTDEETSSGSQVGELYGSGDETDMTTDDFTEDTLSDSSESRDATDTATSSVSGPSTMSSDFDGKAPADPTDSTPRDYSVASIEESDLPDSDGGVGGSWPQMPKIDVGSIKVLQAQVRKMAEQTDLTPRGKAAVQQDLENPTNALFSDFSLTFDEGGVPEVSTASGSGGSGSRS